MDIEDNNLSHLQVVLDKIKGGKEKDQKKDFLKYMKDEKLIKQDMKMSTDKNNTQMLLDCLRYFNCKQFFKCLFTATGITEQNSFRILIDTFQKMYKQKLKIEKQKQVSDEKQQQYKNETSQFLKSIEAALKEKKKVQIEDRWSNQHKEALRIVNENLQNLKECGDNSSEVLSIHDSENQLTVSGILTSLNNSLKIEAKDQKESFQLILKEVKQLKNFAEDLKSRLSVQNNSEVNKILAHFLQNQEKKHNQVSCSQQTIQIIQKEKKTQTQRKQYKSVSISTKIKQLRNNYCQAEILLEPEVIIRKQVQYKESLKAFSGSLFDGFIPGINQEKLYPEYNSERNYLVKAIEDYTDKKIMRTRLLYKFDKYNDHPFHDYIDGIPNIVLVVKLMNNHILCGYSQWPLIRGQSNTGPGFIASLTNKKHFEIQKKTLKLMSYDDYFIIFGNSQIRIKMTEDYIFSNLGIVHKSFVTTEKDPTILFGHSQRQSKTEQYEVHQIHFE